MCSRKEKILKLLQEKKYVSLSFLENSLHYSQSTIRRDLIHLEQIHMLKRVPGGAVLVKKELVENPDVIKYEMNKTEKNIIADLAIDFIEDYATIFLDSSSTNQFLAKKLKTKKNLKVFTPNLVTAMEIDTSKRNQVYVIGGLLGDGKTGGSLSNEMVSQINVDYSFFSCRGIDVNHGASDALETEAGLKNIIKRSSKKTFLLADHTKFNKAYTFQSLEINDIDYIISDKKPSSEISKLEGVEFVYR